MANKKRTLKLINRLKHDYMNLDEDDPLAIKLDNEIEYQVSKMNQYIRCSFHPSEGCKDCRYCDDCDIRARRLRVSIVG